MSNGTRGSLAKATTAQRTARLLVLGFEFVDHSLGHVVEGGDDLVGVRMESTVPTEFPTVVGLVVAFADPVIAGDLNAHTWDSEKQSWISVSE